MVRFKNRYQLVQLSFDDGSCDAGVSEKNIVMAIRAAVELMHGDFGSACLQQSLAIKYFNTATGLFIVRCHREFHPLLASTIPFVTHINQKAATLNTLQVAGTIRSCNKAILSYNRVKIQELQSALASPATIDSIESTFAEVRQHTAS